MAPTSASKLATVDENDGKLAGHQLGLDFDRTTRVTLTVCGLVIDTGPLTRRPSR